MVMWRGIIGGVEGREEMERVEDRTRVVIDCVAAGNCQWSHGVFEKVCLQAKLMADGNHGMALFGNCFS